MEKIVGVRFRWTGKTYDFAAGSLQLVLGDRVVVETVRGIEIGQVVSGPREVDGEPDQELKRVLRLASPEDLERARSNEQKAQRALRVCREKAAKLGVNLKPVDAEYAFDSNKVTIYFTAEGRVDFRELVRELASTLKARVELRQIGVRDEARLLGGLGPCGRPLCCTTFLSEFRPVSIRMAKEQNLALNPGKISGLCGRLMCCLHFEAEGAGACGNGRAADGGGAATAEAQRTAGCSDCACVRGKAE